MSHDVLPTSPQVIVVAGHRGGCGKTALASGLALALARAGQPTALADLALAPAAASLLTATCGGTRPQPWKGRGEEPAPWSHPALPLQVIHAPALPAEADPGAALAGRISCRYLVCDLPVSGPEELGRALRSASLVLLVVPCDGQAFRSLPPFLEAVGDERARPGRRFQTRAVLAGGGVPNPERQALELFQRRYLADLLLKSDFPFDPALRRAMAQGVLELAGEAGAGRAAGVFESLAGEIMNLLPAMRAGEPVQSVEAVV